LRSTRTSLTRKQPNCSRSRPDGPDDADETISVLDEIAEAGGPNLSAACRVQVPDEGSRVMRA
jgi:hypothetical protein